MENKATTYFKEKGLENRIRKMDSSNVSAQDAAQAMNVEVSTIAKSLTFETKNKPMLVVMAGDAKIDSKKFKKTFGFKSKMLEHDEVLKITGYEVGGVCPFALDPFKIDIFLDISIEESEFVYTGCGDVTTLVKVNIEELKEFSNFVDWVDIGKEWEK